MLIERMSGRRAEAFDLEESDTPFLDSPRDERLGCAFEENISDASSTISGPEQLPEPSVSLSDAMAMATECCHSSMLAILL
jgi:hypothetical protein